MSAIIVFTQLKVRLKNSYYLVDCLNINITGNLELKVIFRFWMIFICCFQDQIKLYSIHNIAVIINPIVIKQLVLSRYTHKYTHIPQIKQPPVPAKLDITLLLTLNASSMWSSLQNRGDSLNQPPQSPCFTNFLLVFSLASVFTCSNCSHSDPPTSELPALWLWSWFPLHLQPRIDFSHFGLLVSCVSLQKPLSQGLITSSSWPRSSDFAPFFHHLSPFKKLPHPLFHKHFICASAFEFGFDPWLRRSPWGREGYPLPADILAWRV